MKKQKWGKEKNLYGLQDKATRRKDNENYPKIVFAAAMSAAFLGILVLFAVTYPFLIRPYLEDKKTQAVPENTTIGQVQQEQKLPLADTVQEYLFRRRYVNQPVIFGNEILCTEGEDSSGNPRLQNAVLFTRSQYEAFAVEIDAENDNLLYPQLSDEFIAVADAKVSGGGQIGVLNRKTGKYHKVKEFKGAVPSLSMAKNQLVWFEQLNGELSSVYLYDMEEDKLRSLAVQKELPFVFGGADTDGRTVVFAGLDSRDGGYEEMNVNNRSAVHSVDIESGELSVYEPGMYVYSPKVQGKTVAWLDTDGKTSSTLYASVGGGQPKKIAGDVSGFAVGDGYISYCQNEQMYAYFTGGNVAVRLSREGQKCLFIGDNDGHTMWFDISAGEYQRDVVKYIALEAEDWQR